ncbi:MAG: ABC transporter permease [Kiloniellaceae bacterium]
MTFIAFVIRRFGQALFVMAAAAAVAFLLFQYVGDPVNNMVGQAATSADRAELRRALGLDASPAIQFLRFLGNAATGDFGISYRLGQPVSQVIGERLPATLELSFVAMLFALGAGIPFGVYTALKRKAVSSRLLLTVSLIGVSLPTFMIGILLILTFSVWLGWLPSFGRGQVLDLGLWSTGLLSVSGLAALVLPAVTLGLFQMTLITRLVRAEMLEVLRQDYIKFARARGLSPRAINFGHALKNTLVPVITIAGLQLGNVIAFSIIVETVFQWPGMGQLIIQAIQFGDVPVMAAYIVLIAFLFVTINLAVDVLYFVIDPRLRFDRTVSAGGGG